MVGFLCVFFLVLPFAFVNLPVTSGRAAKIGVKPRRCLLKSLICQEISVKFKLCVIQGDLGGPEGCDRGSLSLLAAGEDGFSTPSPQGGAEAASALLLSRALSAEWKPFTG